VAHATARQEAATPLRPAAWQGATTWQRTATRQGRVSARQSEPQRRKLRWRWLRQSADAGQRAAATGAAAPHSPVDSADDSAARGFRSRGAPTGVFGAAETVGQDVTDVERCGALRLPHPTNSTKANPEIY